MVTHSPKAPMDAEPKRANPESNATLSDGHGNQLRYTSARNTGGSWQPTGWTVAKGVLGCKSAYGLMEFPLMVSASRGIWNNGKLMNIINGTLGQAQSRHQVVRADGVRSAQSPAVPGVVRNEERNADGSYIASTYTLKPDATRTLQDACRAEFEGRGFYYQDGTGHISPPSVATGLVRASNDR